VIRVVVLGSTGSVGSQALDCLRFFPQKFSLVGISANENNIVFQKQIKEFSPSFSVFRNKKKKEKLQKENPSIPFVNSELELLQKSEFDILVLANYGKEVFSCCEYALKKGKRVALASKEILVSHGLEIQKLLLQDKSLLFPLDSEIFALWKCLEGREKKNIHKIILTGSGGPFLNKEQYPKSSFNTFTPNQAISHPKWSMGKKISLDSATLMNKAWEFIEIVRLFDIAPEKVEVVIHPEAHIHSAVEFQDGNILAHISPADMRIPLFSALFFPKSFFTPLSRFSFFQKEMHFYPVDEDRFPSLQFARDALQKNRCSEILQANTEAAEDFFQNKITFDEIFTRISSVLYS